MASSFNEESFEKKLKAVNNTQDSIQSLSLWIIHHKSHHAKIVELWLKVLKKTVQPSHRLTLLYLCNDVVQTCKKKKAFVYNATFQRHLKEAAGLVRDASIKNKVERIFNIWQERGVYDAAFIKSLHKVLSKSAVSGKDKKKKKREHSNHDLPSTKKNKASDGQSIKAAKAEENEPISPPGTPPPPEPPERVTADMPGVHEEIDAEESARILAEFKPHEMIEQITSFQRQKAEIQLKVNQLSNLKLDASNLEAIKHLKDRAHGNDFSSRFEDSCTKLEDLVKRQTQLSVDQLVLLETLKTSETFYEEQYREAKIVANAYKNYGARINNMKKRLDEMKKNMPAPDSPFPSPDVNAPSPGNTPPHVAGAGYNSYSANKGENKYEQNSWMYGGAASGKSGTDDNLYDASPPVEAPSPDGTPPGLNFGGSETTSASFESRLASLFSQSRKESSSSTTYSSRHSTSHSKSYKEEGSMTPLDDETPTTPVQDEHSASPPKRSTPPKKENPIDFLSRLISQSHKPVVSKSGAPSFLDTLSLLSNVTPKSQASLVDTHKGPNTSPQQSWATWKSKSNGDSSPISQPSSPLSYRGGGSQPPSPTQYSPSVPPPSMVPPPIPMPVPPPAIALSMGLTMPPPPPPPFNMTPGGPSMDFSSPPPGFQKTSPGQKENWPDTTSSSQASDLSSGSRAGHSSVLKELVPAKDYDSDSLEPKATTSLIDPDAMEIVSDEEDSDLLGEDSESGDAKLEFAQKLKQKTLAGGSMKSHVFIPNPERPNLMTLTAPDDLDEEDMIDNDTMVEEKRSSAWPSKSHKSSKKSSRSRSRSRDRSHKHKKKKKHKRAHSSDEDVRTVEMDDSKVGSIVKRIDSRSRSSRDSRGDKYDDRYDDRKYDKYDDRDRHRSRGTKDFRDPVEAYTQAYRDAVFQQLNQGRVGNFTSMPMDSRRSSYSKY